MGISNTLRKILDRKMWEPVAPCPIASSTGSYIASSSLHDQFQFYMGTITTPYMYDPNEDSWIALPNPSYGTGATGPGMCGDHHPYGPSGTATAGSTTSLTTNLTIPGSLAGYTIRITGGPGAGDERVIAYNTVGANAVITPTDPFSAAITSSSTYIIMSGRWYAFLGTTASTMKYYDVATNTWVACSTTGIPATFLTDAKIRFTSFRDARFDKFTPSSSTSTTITRATASWTTDMWKGQQVRVVTGTGAGQYRYVTGNTPTVLTVDASFSPALDSTSVVIIEGFSAGKASSATSTTLVHTGKTWAASQWINFQVRIVAGLGAGQIRTITANTTDTLTVAAWTTTPDSTSRFIIEGNDDHAYLAGNAAVAMYRYSVSGNSWTTLAPGVARSGAPSTGMSLSYISRCRSPLWVNESANLNGRRLYSFRAGATAALDYYDIPSNAWVNLVTYQRQTEAFTTGSSWDNAGDGTLYVQKDATGRWFRFKVDDNTLDAWNTMPFAQGAALVGDRVFDVAFVDNGDEVRFIYQLANTSTALYRCLII